MKLSLILFTLFSRIAFAAHIADTAFKPTVETPTFTKSHPLIILDQGHNNLLAKDGRYEPIMGLLRSDGYRIKTSDGKITADLLKDAKILYISAVLGSPDTKDPKAGASPFTSAEIKLIKEWVKNGGGLLASGDHPPMGQAISKLLNAFEIVSSESSVESESQAVSEFKDPSILSFSKDDMEASHPIIQGQKSTQKLTHVIAFAGQSLMGPAGSVGFLKLHDDAVDKFRDGHTQSAKGHFEAIALKFGKGHVVSFGDATVFTSKLDTKTNLKHGINYPGTDNAQLALNTFHWLSGLFDR